LNRGHRRQRDEHAGDDGDAAAFLPKDGQGQAAYERAAGQAAQGEGGIEDKGDPAA